MKESLIQKQILDYLQILENRGLCYCFRAGSGAVKLESGRYFKSGKAGVPDIVCCYKGQFIGIEVKNEKGKQSIPQKRAEELISNCEGQYIIARNLEDVFNIFNK